MRLARSIVLATLASASCLALAQDHVQAQASTQSSAAVEFSATLAKSIDAGKNRRGDQVFAVSMQDLTSHGRIIVPRGATLIGRITQARERSIGSASPDGSAPTDVVVSADSRLGIRFDKAVLRDGQQITINAVVAAIAVADADPPEPLHDATFELSGVAAASASSALVASPGALGGVNASGEWTAGSRGAFGLPDLDVSAEASASGGAAICSSVRNVHLDRGTRLWLRSEPAAVARLRTRSRARVRPQ